MHCEARTNRNQLHITYKLKRKTKKHNRKIGIEMKLVFPQFDGYGR